MTTQPRMDLSDIRLYKIDYLAKHAKFIPALAQAVHHHWSPIIKDERIEDRVRKFEQHCNENTLPIAWVAHLNGRVLGTAALRAHDLDGYDHLTPWLGGVYVMPRHRGQGIGKTLCRVVEDKAFEMGFKEMFLMTLDAADFYRTWGWNVREPTVWHGRPGHLMRKSIG
ncbi:MAG: GNAT family N-acetyltransferase [Spirochaetia bacterium]|nr:GNAT family N-acetyltransferase [Spirochaetia bacterium]